MSKPKKSDDLPHFGRLGYLTPEQSNCLERFRTQLIQQGAYSPPRTDDHLLLRFLRARRFDVHQATVMFLNCEKWRRDFGVDALSKTFDYTERSQVSQVYPRYYHKTDKLGRPIYIEQLGNLELKKMMGFTTEERFIQNHIVEYEKFIDYKLPACSYRAGKHIEQSCSILDLKGIPLGQFPSVSSLVRTISQFSQDYYPETLGRMFLINAPMLFTTVWNVIKVFLDEGTVNKIVILGKNYTPTLLEYIDAENLPAQFGGKCACPGGCDHSDAGPWQGLSQQDWDKINQDRWSAIPTAVIQQYRQGTLSTSPSSTLPRVENGSPQSASPNLSPGQTIVKQ